MSRRRMASGGGAGAADQSLAPTVGGSSTPEARIISCAGTLNALGHRIRRGEHRALPRSRRRFVKRMRGVIVGDTPLKDVRGAVAAAIGVQVF